MRFGEQADRRPLQRHHPARRQGRPDRPQRRGKTTLLKLILGELQPTPARCARARKLQVAYFDQMRAGLDLDATLADTISPGSEWVESAASAST
jgi:ATPase subunit of ABC transporter with duplicated ATPase domains